jgi:hypothetical protein
MKGRDECREITSPWNRTRLDVNTTDHERAKE